MKKEQQKSAGFWASLGAIIAAPFMAGVEFVDTRPGGKAVRRHLGDKKFEVVAVGDGEAQTFAIESVSRRTSKVRERLPRAFDKGELAAAYALGAQDVADSTSKLRRRTINAHERAVDEVLKAEKKVTKKAGVEAEVPDPLATAPAAV